jgi:hypothetical protein
MRQVCFLLGTRPGKNPRNRMSTKLSLLAAGAALSLLALTGCGTGAAAPAATGSTSATATEVSKPQPATATSAAANVAEPATNSMLDKDGKAGMSAFSYYWFDVENYVLQTGDVQALQAVSDPSCDYCNQQIKTLSDLYSSGGWMKGGQPKVLNVYTDGTPGTDGAVPALLEFRADPSTTYGKGGVEQGSTPFDVKGTILSVSAKYTDGAWKMVSVENTPNAELPSDS